MVAKLCGCIASCFNHDGCCGTAAYRTLFALDVGFRCLYLHRKSIKRKIMVRKIQAAEYQKRYDNMSAGERSAYEGRVGEWLRGSAPVLMGKSDSFESKLQDVLTLSAGWNDRECSAFEEGAVLLSALMSGGETWLPELLYTKAAGRCIKRMCGLLSDVLAENGSVSAMPSQHTGQVAKMPKEEPAAGTSMATQAVGANRPFRGQLVGSQQGEGPDKQKTVGTVPPGKPTDAGARGAAGVPVRPKHIDQYVHLLPKKTQERAAKYGPLMRELDEMREKQRLLMDAEGVSSKDREAVAKRIVAIDKEIGGIKAELDTEWERLVKQGAVTVDDLGMAHVVNGEELAADSEDATKELTSGQKARRRELRKFLTDTRRGNGKTREEHRAKWREAWREYLTLEPLEAALGDEKIREAAAHYGIDAKEAAVA